MSDDLKNFLGVSRASRVEPTAPGESYRKAEFTATDGTVEVPEDAPEGDALKFLEKVGQNPADWEVTGFRRIEYGRVGDPMVSTRFTYRRRPEATGEQIDIEDLLATISTPPAPTIVETEDGPIPGAAVLIGDNQFGKGLDDPYEAIGHALRTIDTAADRISQAGGADEILVAWLGDHIEGFTSQGGANVWRTKLTLTEQLRAIRRIMLYALERFYPLGNRIVFAAIPGNHGDPQRIAGKGLTTYDDNHDVEALNGVADAAELSGAYPRAEFYVPERDEISLVVEVGGVKWGLVHGHQWRAGKHFDWWAKQTFGGAVLAGADVLVCGHWHHLLIEEAGKKLFIQTSALETESQWFAHLAGTRGNPGLVLVYTNGMEVGNVQPIRAHQ